jgi:hypothetical protein
MPKRNFDMNDVIKVLDKPEAIKPSWNTKAKTWNYDIKGEDIEGEPLTVRVAVEEDELVLVTGF